MHLNDDQIQDYLDGNLKPDDQAVGHLDGCPDCQKVVENYRALYRSLAVEPGFELSPDFAEKVVSGVSPAKVSPVPEKPEWFKVREWVVMVAGLAAVTGAALFFINPISLVKSLFGWTGAAEATGGGLAQEMSTYVSGLGFNPMLLLSVALTIIAVAVIDRFVIRPRLRRGTISLLA